MFKKLAKAIICSSKIGREFWRDRIQRRNYTGTNIATRIFKKGKVVGYLYAEKIQNNRVLCSWSLCNHKDKFSRKTARQVAKNRILSAVVSIDNPDGIVTNKIPNSIMKDIIPFVRRAKQYFKVWHINVV